MSSQKAIIVVPYDPNWVRQFDALYEQIWPAVSDFAIGLEHVGSTAVVGLAAKPIIDLDVIVPGPACLAECKARLADLGYRCVGERGVPDRHAFEGGFDGIEHHLYVCIEGSFSLLNHLLLRDHLQSHPKDAERYGQLKTALADRHGDDIEAYIEGKTAFIVGILESYGCRTSDLSTVAAVNKKPTPS